MNYKYLHILIESVYPLDYLIQRLKLIAKSVSSKMKDKQLNMLKNIEIIKLIENLAKEKGYQKSIYTIRSYSILPTNMEAKFDTKNYIFMEIFMTEQSE